MNKSFYNFEKIELRGLFYFNFFNRNVQSKHVCQLAYNTSVGYFFYGIFGNYKKCFTFGITLTNKAKLEI